MTVGLPEPFPRLRMGKDDRNPAIRLFGRRFILEQGPLELLAEFLALVCCSKRIPEGDVINAPLPSLGVLASWPDGAPLQYRPPVKLNLKLFSFLGVSRLDMRHSSHRQHYEELVGRLAAMIRINDNSTREVVEWFEELMQGFQGSGSDRVWCAQTFFPVVPAFLTKETIWKASVAKKNNVDDWDSVIERFGDYFEASRVFLARGGEVLYLQVFNSLTTDPRQVGEFVDQLRDLDDSCVLPQESDPISLHATLLQSLGDLSGERLAALNRFADEIEGLDQYTARAATRDQDSDTWLNSGWCPRESWKEGYLFAIELSRVLAAPLDPIERLETLLVGCALQVLRSLCAQSVRYVEMDPAEGPWGYAWVMTPPEGASAPLRMASQRNLQVVQSMIYQALRADALGENAKLDWNEYGSPESALKARYNEADRKYGHKLLLSLGKKLGLIAPKRGRGARFVMTDEVLRYLVLALLRPGERCTYDTFLRRLHLHYGMAIEEEYLDGAARWSGLAANRTIQPGKGSWLAAMLRAGGFLTELSDACAVVRNPYEAEGEGAEGGGA
jgi:hypothetical protein